jgi:hypothetical protein
MTYGEFLEFIPDKCMYETIYTDSDGHSILVIRVLDAYGMVNKANQKPWVGLTDEEMLTLEETTTCAKDESWLRNLTRAIEATLKEKNT